MISAICRVIVAAAAGIVACASCLVMGSCGGTSERVVQQAVAPDSALEATVVDVLGGPMGAIRPLIYRSSGAIRALRSEASVGE